MSDVFNRESFFFHSNDGKGHPTQNVTKGNTIIDFFCFGGIFLQILFLSGKKYFPVLVSLRKIHSKLHGKLAKVPNGVDTATFLKKSICRAYATKNFGAKKSMKFRTNFSRSRSKSQFIILNPS
jgi:hypothetical protein